MTDIQGLSGEGIRLNFNVGLAHGVNERRFTDVWIPCEENGSFIRVDCGETTQVFSDFFKVRKRRVDFSNHGTNSTQSGSFQTLASVQGVCVFDELEIIFAHVVDHILGGFDMAQGELVMVLVVQDVKKISVEWVDVFNFGEIFENIVQLFIEGLLAELYFPHVKRSDSTDGITGMDDGGGFSLGF